MSDDRTIAFIDLAGYTALTEAHGDHASLDLLDEFTGNARDAIAASGTEFVKSVGDAIMLAAPTPPEGLEAVRLVFEACYASDAFPEPRAGLHHGPIVARDGDYFGATVNLAARVAGRAGSGQALVTATVVDAAHAARLDILELGAQRFRNVFDPLEVWSVELCPTHVDVSVDPVCRMRVSCQAAIAKVRHAGTEHSLCSLACLRAFAADPDRYLDSMPGAGSDSVTS